MNTISEIENAIERLSKGELLELFDWIDQFRLQREPQAPLDAWLDRARGAARPDATTEGVLTLTRGEE